VLIIIALLLTEGALRWLNVESYVRTFPGQNPDGPGVPWASKDLQLGWISNEQMLEKAYGRDWIINREGFRDSRDFDEPIDSLTSRIVVLGDSFMWGSGIGFNATFPAQLQKKVGTSYEVFNISAPGWGIDQMYLAYEKFKSALEPDVVILAYVDDDVNRVLEAYRIYEHLNKPVLSIRDNELSSSGPISQGQRLLNGVARQSVLFGLLLREHYLLNDAYPVVRHIFSKIAQDMAQDKGQFIVLRIPTFDSYRLQNRTRRLMNGFSELSTDMGFQYLDPATELMGLPNPWGLYQKDGHLNESGYLFLIDYVCRHAFDGC